MYSTAWHLCNLTGVFFQARMSVMWNVCLPVLLVTLLIALSQFEVHWLPYLVRKKWVIFPYQMQPLTKSDLQNVVKFCYMIVCTLDSAYSKKNVTLLYLKKFYYMLVYTTEWLTMWNICRNTCIFILSYLSNFN